jgi:predicted aldo/keto reductase-like oxidoreductase
MRYSEYGKTGKQVSAIGFGGMRFDTSLSAEENAAIVRHAFDQGINYFDTAPGYCDDQSEAIFGVAFKGMPRDQFYVSTKGMPTSFDTAEKAREAVHKSLKRLGVEKIDFYHVWCLRKMEHYDLAMRAGGQYEGLKQCQEEGLIEHIVCSSHQPGNEIRTILRQGHFEGVLMGINILNFPYRWDGVAAAAEFGAGVAAMNPLAGGAIPQHEKELAFLARDGETPTEAALRFLVSAPEVNIALNGFTSREHIDMACRVAEKAEPFTHTETDAIRRNLGEHITAMCTGCGYCKGCPQDIPVPSYMQFYNEKQVFGAQEEEMRKRVTFQHNWGLLVGREAEADECIECGACEEKCTQHLPIIERLRDIAKWERTLQCEQ